MKSSRITASRSCKATPDTVSLAATYVRYVSPHRRPHRYVRGPLFAVRYVVTSKVHASGRHSACDHLQINQRQMRRSSAGATIDSTNVKFAWVRMLQCRKLVCVLCQTLIERRRKYLYSSRMTRISLRMHRFSRPLLKSRVVLVLKFRVSGSDSLYLRPR